MNRFAARGLAEEALRGVDIVVLTAGANLNAETTHLISAQMGDTPRSVTHSNGRSVVRVQGAGSIRLLSWRSRGLRGISAPIVYLDGGVDAANLDMNLVHAIIASHPAGEIVRA